MRAIILYICSLAAIVAAMIWVRKTVQAFGTIGQVDGKWSVTGVGLDALAHTWPLVAVGILIGAIVAYHIAFALARTVVLADVKDDMNLLKAQREHLEKEYTKLFEELNEREKMIESHLQSGKRQLLHEKSKVDDLRERTDMERAWIDEEARRIDRKRQDHINRMDKIRRLNDKLKRLKHT